MQILRVNALKYLAAVTLFVLTTVCASFPDVSDRLFCGLSIPGGGVVSKEEADRFVEEVVEPRFPDGFTVWRARGQWKGGSEDVMVIEIVHPRNPAADQAVEEIASEYRRRFRQEAVLRVSAPVEMDIITQPE